MTIEEILTRTSHIPSTVYKPEQEMWLKHPTPSGALIVDFGTGWGKSAASLALCNPDSLVKTFDTGEPYIIQKNVAGIEEYRQKVLEYLDIAGVKNVEFSVGDSTEKIVDNIDFLNIDTSHQYEDFLIALKEWIPRVKDGGLVSLHYWAHPVFTGSSAAIAEYLQMKEHAFRLELLDVAVHEKIVPAIFRKVRI